MTSTLGETLMVSKGFTRVQHYVSLTSPISMKDCVHPMSYGENRSRSKRAAYSRLDYPVSLLIDICRSFVDAQNL